ncbi:conserved exported hypothetical protein [Sphingomonas sp. EC-HK361]|uniref:hypothetical protein n=1 Tax=Sphingomonas sp. EC-HK361 TaxID=2038397 RepID=UPI00125A7946|nr:hypothetical protein [Sphingomonas sp. EC-HK361]VVT16425.1 conserved exported hypothetical protein [Sphingomonas sp. EC-HK361]
MRRYVLTLAAATGLVGLAAATDAWGRDERPVPEAIPAGKAQSCISLSRINETRVRSDRVIDFVTNDRRVFRNTLPNACPSLGFEQRFAYATTLGQLCSIDTITVLQGPGFGRGATCGLGMFQPVMLTPRPKR